MLSYALFGILIKKLPPLPSEITVAAILLCASLFIVPISLAIPGTYDVTFAWDWVWSILFLGIVSTGLGNLLFLIILKRTSVNFASLNNYLVPIVGVALGILSLEERAGLEQPHRALFDLSRIGGPPLYFTSAKGGLDNRGYHISPVCGRPARAPNRVPLAQKYRD